MKLLLGPSIAEKIKDVLADASDERVAVVAFVGRNPLRWLPDKPEGTHIYCWPHPGATNPDGIRQLIKAGVHVHLVPNMHAKVYWSRTGGAVVGSANLSHNGLGDAGLFEAGVYLAPGIIDIEEVLQSLRPSAISQDTNKQAFDKALAVLDREHNAYCARNPSTASFATTASRSKPTFGEWLASTGRKDWQINYWTYEMDRAPNDLNTVVGEGQPEFECENWCAEDIEDRLSCNIPTLEIRLSSKTFKRWQSTKPKWWMPTTSYTSTDRAFKDMPFIWACREKIPAGVEVPFNNEEPAFLRALDRAIEGAGEAFLNAKGPVSRSFVEILAKNYRDYRSELDE